MDMKKILIAILMSLVMISCGNTQTSQEEISFEKTVKTTIIWNIDENRDDCTISIQDSIVNLKYSSIDNVLHVKYNGQDHTFKNITISDYSFIDCGIEANCTAFICKDDTLLVYRTIEQLNEEDIWMDRTIY